MKTLDKMIALAQVDEGSTVTRHIVLPTPLDNWITQKATELNIDPAEYVLGLCASYWLDDKDS